MKTYTVKKYETFWKNGILMERIFARDDNGIGRNWVSITQKTSIYNYDKFETGANVEYRNLDTAESKRGYIRKAVENMYKMQTVEI